MAKWEGSKKDETQDKRLAKKYGMSMKDWEKSSMDKKHDRKKSAKGLRKGGAVKKADGGTIEGRPDRLGPRPVHSNYYDNPGRGGGRPMSAPMPRGLGGSAPPGLGGPMPAHAEGAMANRPTTLPPPAAAQTATLPTAPAPAGVLPTPAAAGAGTRTMGAPSASPTISKPAMFSKGGAVKSGRGDGIASRGKTKGRMC